MIRIYDSAAVSREEIFARTVSPSQVEEIVAGILEEVRTNKDAALKRLCQRFDGAAPDPLEVTPAEMDAAMAAVNPEMIRVLKKAAANISAFHRRQVRNSFVINEQEGIILGQKVMPLSRVGLYIPGGTASYPSSVLMNAIPAKIAGVPEIVMTTPAKGGVINPLILTAARIAGVNRVFKVGGAQAVGALAYGTESVPRVDKIVGPGNAFVAEAKRQVFGLVAIDMIAGPSEILVLADGTCNPVYIAADLLSQAEHDRLASPVLVTDSPALAAAVQAEVERQLCLLPRQEIARASIENNGKIILTPDMDAAVAIANEIAPEHLEICVDNPFDYLSRIRSAGSIFLGKYCPEALGDYFAGPNHTLPTSGTARFSSPLSVDDFIRKSSFTYYTRDALAEVYQDIAAFAEAEGLSAHARSAAIRFEQNEEPGTEQKNNKEQDK